MLDIKLIRRETDYVKGALARRGVKPEVIDDILALDVKRRDLITKADDLRKERNQISESLGRRKKAGEDISADSVRVREMGKEIASLDAEKVQVEEEQVHLVEVLPNLPQEDIPDGPDSDYNKEVRRWGECEDKKYDFTVKPHWDIGEELGIFDAKRAIKLSGSRFWLLCGEGAKLERAIYTYMLDLHTQKHGYKEMLPPVLVTPDTMYATGQLPKFKDDLFHCSPNDLYLIPTAEVPLTNIHREEILNGKDLPLYYTACTACFRSEAGAAGRDSRGIVRVHQFNKVEMVKISNPDTSNDELEKMVNDAEDVLKGLGIPYRVMLLCAGDMGLSSSKTYDLEFWSPAQNRFIEISSCSNCRDYQARRANMRFRREPSAPTEFVHTLNGSGLAVGRTMVAILENFQNADGSVTIPEALRPYMGGQEKLMPVKVSE
ncbi:serine--tRNA ligase [bacterium]|nr:serine--tRNA ligase [bacterium]